ALAGSYRFAHDRIQEAAYALLDEEARVDIHLRAGRALLRPSREPPARDTPAADALPDAALRPVIEHLSRARARLDERERLELAALYARAGKRAHAAPAYASALACFEAG